MSVDTWGHPQREQISTGCPTNGAAFDHAGGVFANRGGDDRSIHTTVAPQLCTLQRTRASVPVLNISRGLSASLLPEAKRI